MRLDEIFRMTESDDGLIQRAIAMFGLTRNAREAGYILPDGRMLDFSGRHYSGDYRRDGESWKVHRGPDYMQNMRYVDHRELDHEDEELTTDKGTDGMLEFMRRTGAVRWMPGQGFGVCVMPTPRQIAVIIANWESDDLINIDVTDASGTDHGTQVRPKPQAVIKFLKSVLPQS